MIAANPQAGRWWNFLSAAHGTSWRVFFFNGEVTWAEEVTGTYADAMEYGMSKKSVGFIVREVPNA